MKLTILLGSLLLGSTLAELEAGNGAQNEGNLTDVLPLSLTSLGNVEGKHYFVESTPMSFWEASAHCSNFGMRLGTIQTAAQASFLQSVHHPVLFNGAHWIGAHDSQLLSEFVWGGTGANLDSSFLQIGWRGTGPLTCLDLYSTPDGAGNLETRPCNAEFASICETTL